MADNPSDSDIVHGVPPLPVSSTSTRVNHTGSWKYIRPVFQDSVAPCNQACPIGIDVEAYMNLVREGRERDAIDVLLRENPLPAVTGRVCYHPCENACNRGDFDQAVSIHGVERMLGDRALELPAPAPAPRTQSESIGIVGSGPAGLACAYHLVRMGYGVTVYEAEAKPGGVLRYGIPEYRLPKRVLDAEIGRIRALGVEFRCHTRVGQDLSFEEVTEHDAAFVATGVHRSRALGIEGEDLQGVRRGLDFLRDVNRGMKPRLGRRVVVVGGGNTAMDCARTAVRLGADVTVLYRRSRDEMPANPEEVEEALQEGVKLELLAAPIKACGDSRVPDEEPLAAIEATFGDFEGLDPEPYVVGLQCVRMKLGDPDESGRRRPVAIPGSEFSLDADTVLTALGEEAELEFLPEKLQGDSGVIRVGPLGGTRGGAVFAGGDITDEPHTVAFAMGSGKRAAIGIDWFLRSKRGEMTEPAEVGELKLGPEGNVSATRWNRDDPVRRTNHANSVVAAEAINTAHFEHESRAVDRFRVLEDGASSFRETNVGLTRDQAVAEARRCFNCAVCNECEICLIFCPDVAITRKENGGFDIDYEYCKGCGVCAVECPRGAIVMTREGL